MRNSKILIIGDLMLDTYILGKSERISPEAPVPVFLEKSRYYELGGAGNVAKNINDLNVPCSIIGHVSNRDKQGEIVKDILSGLKNVSNETVDLEIQTTEKARYIEKTHRYQMFRHDRETTKFTHKGSLYRKIEELIKDFEIIVISDYGKGVISEPLMDFVRDKKNKNAKIIYDPKSKNLANYRNVYLMTPNKKELRDIFSNDFELISRYGVENILNTLGEMGSELYTRKNRKFVNDYFPVEKVDVYNVSGAGDTIVSVIAVCLILNINLEKAAKIANKCAGYVVSKQGTSSVPYSYFSDVLEEFR